VVVMKQGVDSENPTGLTTLEWVDWFNNRRLLEPIGNIPPAEAEQRYYAMLEQPAMAA
jgi:putative transposase